MYWQRVLQSGWEQYQFTSSFNSGTSWLHSQSHCFSTVPPLVQDFFVAVTDLSEICLKIPCLSILLDKKFILDNNTFLPLQVHGGKRGKSQGIQSATCRLEARTEVEWLSLLSIMQQENHDDASLKSMKSFLFHWLLCKSSFIKKDLKDVQNTMSKPTESYAWSQTLFIYSSTLTLVSQMVQKDTEKNLRQTNV